MTDGQDPRHPHERELGIPPTYDSEGRCLVCGLICSLQAERDEAHTTIRTLLDRAEQAERERDAVIEELVSRIVTQWINHNQGDVSQEAIDAKEERTRARAWEVAAGSGS